MFPQKIYYRLLSYCFKPFALCDPLYGSQYQCTCEQQYLENGETKHGLQKNFFKRQFDKLSNDIQVNKLCTCSPLVIDV